MNEALKRAQANYRDKCRIINIRVNTETEAEICEWIDLRPCVSAAVKAMIRKEIRQLKEHIVRVNYYSVEVKYHGSFDNYTEKELIEMGIVKASREMIDCWDKTEKMNQFDAMKIDGQYKAEIENSCNHLARVSWTTIEEEDYLLI